jgi:hypothetical protein
MNNYKIILYTESFKGVKRVSEHEVAAKNSMQALMRIVRCCSENQTKIYAKVVNGETLSIQPLNEVNINTSGIS